MLKKMISKLEQGKGRSEYVISVVIDIRGFSSFSNTHQAPDIGTFIAKFYTALLKNYFSNAAYAKPTGDGLLLLFPFTEQTLSLVSESVISNCLKAVNEYPEMLTNDPMLTFDIPKNIGIGVARGTAFCLFAGKEDIDYSGPVLNLAARLNDFARPRGVVIDGAFKIEQILSKELQEQFQTKDAIFIRGIAEEKSVSIAHSNDVEIPPEASQPIAIEKWEKFETTLAYADIKKLSANYRITLPKEPISQHKINVALVFPSPTLAGHERNAPINILNYASDANGPRVTIDKAVIQQTLINKKLKSTSKVTFSVQFIAKPA